jgi:RsmE family RNA methyltransferase
VNLLLVEAHEIADDAVVLEGRRAAHLAQVLRVAPGRSLRVGVIDGPRGRAEVIDVAPGPRVTVRLTLDEPPSPRPTIDVIVAVPRPKVLSRVLQHLAASGVDRVDLVNAWRVDASYFGSRRLDHAEIEADLRLGAEQGATTALPAVAVHRLLVPYLDEVLAPRLAVARAAAELRAALAHPGAALGVEACVHPGDGARVVVAIGPEGGWVASELASFERLGFTPISLGAAILRTEAAVATVLGQIALLRRLAPT